ncbi:cytochrome P450 2G1-like isoform X2 [Phyllobates terribilis]|uniref:cytochrome P450 2G1-like isoform X2 n=1 Tax=Phyllobates terribilis TaxID=111132 RepID=UPI003CCA837F
MYLSENITFLLTAAVSCLILIISFLHFWRKGNLPPGPIPLPILGNLLQLRKEDIVKSLLSLSEKYGEVFTVYLGSRPVIVVTGYKAVKEVYVDRGDDFLARGDVACFDSVHKNYESLVEPLHYLNKATCNVIFTIMFGNRHEYEDVELLNVMSLMYATASITSSKWGQFYEMFPWVMRYIPGRHQKIFICLKNLIQFVEKRVEINKKNFYESNPRSYADAFLTKMEKENTNPKTEFHMTNLLNSTLQIFVAGVETTSTTLTYSLLLLMKFPQMLEKVHKEIDQVVGRDRCPKMQDRSKMSFTNAVIHEIQRFSDLLPMGLPRKTTKDITYRGYSIPKNTNVYPMLTTVLKDPTHFPYPNEFNPQNFLDENGEFKKNDAFMPLAAGKRICMGENLARVEIFIILITILQNFNLKSPIPPEDLDITPEISGLGNFPKLFNLAFIPRLV